MADQPAEGRARGRARGRSRLAQQGQQPEAARGPTGPPPAATAHPTATAGGRRNHRGVPRADVEAVTRGMATAEIREDTAGRGAMRRREEDLPEKCTRPPTLTDKTGTSGQRINLVANYFEVLSKPHWAVQQYHVEFAPLVESPRVRRGLISNHKDTLGPAYLFDGMSDLKTFTKLEKVTELYSQRNTDGENIRITIKHVAELTPGHPELGRLYNTQMRRNLQHLEFILLGRHYFDRQGVSEVEQYNLQIWQGVITSIRQQEEKLMMLVDTTHKVVRRDTALDIIREIQKRSRDPQNEAVQELVGTIVMTMYNNKTYRVEDIAWNLNPTSKFETKAGPITYVDYYQRQYEIRVKDMSQPLLLASSKEREIRNDQRKQKQIYLIPEICNLTGLTDKMRTNFSMMKELGMHTRIDPTKRVSNLQKFIKRVTSNPAVQKEMTSWQIRFSENLVSLNGRVLNTENIIQGQCKFTYDPKKANFNTEMRGKSLHVAKGLQDWIVVCTRRDQNTCSEFLATMGKVCPPMGMNFNMPKVIYIDNDRVSSYTQALQENRSPRTSIVVFVVPNNSKNRYDALKKNTCVDFPIPSQVVVSRTLSNRKMLMSVATKIGIQMNCKLGGEAWAVDIPFKMSVMIIGYDTYHDSNNKSRSAGAFVASLNPSFTRWYSRVSFHHHGGWEELSNHLKVNLTSALKRFIAENGRAPSLIIFYRDGVGDGQVRYVEEWELNQFKRTISEFLESGVPIENMKTHFVFIIVNKRVNTRFFAVQGPRYGNPPPGTVVDTVVTRHDRYDFFLVPQSVGQGTVGPTMFNVIGQHTGLKPEHIQRLSYKLTHLYFNWPGTVSVPAPCLYAHKLAFLTGQSLHHEPAEELADKLFYL